MNLSQDELAALARNSARIGVFFRLETDPVVRLWLGVGPFETTQPDVLDGTGAKYNGFGEVGSVPALKQMVNGAAQRVEFTISGVTGDILQIASGGDAQQVKGKRVSVGFAVMDDNWSLLGPIKWIQNYTADYLAIQQVAPTEVGQLTVRTVTLSAGTLMTGRRRPGLAYFTNQDQRARYPTDYFCERTPLYANGFNKTWPRLSA
ncbi:hypothetical protein [Nitrobacter sp. TKz-YC01]|uniref:hypothetical protein n=1 Tax=Nitrobacter sp. TKz-YC01 TaxID=3398703 RepID=UPI003A0FBFA1